MIAAKSASCTKQQSSSHHPKKGIARHNEKSSSYCHPNLVSSERASGTVESLQEAPSSYISSYGHPGIILFLSQMLPAACQMSPDASQMPPDASRWAAAEGPWSSRLIDYSGASPPLPEIFFVRSPGPKTNISPQALFWG